MEVEVEVGTEVEAEGSAVVAQGLVDPPLPTARVLSAVDIADITATAVNAVTHSISAVTAVHTSSAPDTVFITLYPLKLLHLRI